MWKVPEGDPTKSSLCFCSTISIAAPALGSLSRRRRQKDISQVSSSEWRGIHLSESLQSKTGQGTPSHQAALHLQPTLHPRARSHPPLRATGICPAARETSTVWNFAETSARRHSSRRFGADGQVTFPARLRADAPTSSGGDNPVTSSPGLSAARCRVDLGFPAV